MLASGPRGCQVGEEHAEQRASQAAQARPLLSEKQEPKPPGSPSKATQSASDTVWATKKVS